jgi:hypothetical protein
MLDIKTGVARGGLFHHRAVGIQVYVLLREKRLQRAAAVGVTVVLSGKGNEYRGAVAKSSGIIYFAAVGNGDAPVAQLLSITFIKGFEKLNAAREVRPGRAEIMVAELAIVFACFLSRLRAVSRV